MMGLHTLFPHSQRPLRSYYDDLVNGNNSYMFNNQLPSSGAVPGPNQVGPWDDIMCWLWPQLLAEEPWLVRGHPTRLLGPWLGSFKWTQTAPRPDPGYDLLR